VRPACVFRHVSAGRASLLAGGIRGEIPPCPLHRTRNLPIHHAGLYQGTPILRVYLVHAVSSRENEQYAANVAGDQEVAQVEGQGSGHWIPSWPYFLNYSETRSTRQWESAPLLGAVC
jgi:hypothetical protein